MKEYRIGKFYAGVVYVGGLLLVALFSFLLLMPFLPGFEKDIQKEAYYYFLAPLSILMIVVFVIGIIETAKGKFIIDTHKIVSIGAFSKKELLFDEIKGYRITDKFIFIEAKNKDQKTIKIASQTTNLNDIKDWLKNQYVDLDRQDKKNEKKEILNNPKFGWSKEEREETLKRASKTVKIFNWAGGIAAVLGFFYPNPYSLVVTICIVFPIIGLILFKYYKGLIQIDSRENSSYPSIFAGLFFPAIAVFIRSMFDFNIFNYSNIWMPMTVLGLVFTALFIIGNSEFKFNKAKDFLSILFLIALMAAYSYGTIVFVNCNFDTSKNLHYKSSVLSKRISTGKSKTYYIELAPWGKQKNPDEVSVSEEEYNTYNEKDAVHVYFMKGKFEIPWYEISK
ncbi:PIG-Y family protein [Flavobacterium artemisiae]|uniref:PIG-Y family protein n=1 Tax=Flavobacterium artemisiae TaxID=2126556 RepID=A0ABW4HG61_9FLAO